MVDDGSSVPAWDVFISHASEDKAAVAAPLALLLERAGLRVWLDSRELQIGDPLRQKIDDGLAHSRFGVVILSPAYFAKRWTRNELDAFFATEDASRVRLLPIWHDVDEASVRQASPMLAGRLSGRTSDGLENVARSIASAVLSSQDSPASTSPGLTGRMLRRLDEDGSADAVRGFLRLHPEVIAAAVGAHGGHYRVFLDLQGGGNAVDAAIGRHQPTNGSFDWTLVAVASARVVPVHADGSHDPDVERAVNAVSGFRTWAARHLADARRLVPGLEADALGVVFAGRRAALDAPGARLLKQWSDELAGVRIRTLDSLVDACTELERSRRSER